MFINTLKKKQINSGLLIMLVLAILAILPWVLSGYWIRLITTVFMFAVVAKGIDLMMGYLGYVAYGNIVFFGIGAYTAGIGMSHGLPFLLALILAVFMSALVSIFVGTPVLRLRGPYFTVASIGLNGAMMAVALNATELTGGASGILFPLIKLSPALTNMVFYFAMLGLLLFTLGINILIIRSRMGFAIRSIKANEDAARSLGINTVFYKTATWAISAAITSVAGAIYGYWMSYISTTDVFNIMSSVTAVLMVLLGGMGTILGPVIGAVIFQILSEVIWSNFMAYHTGILGIITIMVILFLPRGVLTEFTARFKERKSSKRAEKTHE